MNGPDEGRPQRLGTVTSADGTSIGYYALGKGPAVVLVHGAGQTGENLRSLATHLSDEFALFVPDRRGRGRSGPAGDAQGLGTEIEDLCALLDLSGARLLFGLSAGAVIAIETARRRPKVAKLALYEPPLSFDGVVHGAWVPRYEHALEAGKLGTALVAAMKGTADRTALRLVPGFLLSAPLNLLIKRTPDRATTPGRASPRQLIPTVRYDARVVLEAAGPLERFAELDCEVLLLGGSRSAKNLQASLDGLERVLAHAERVTLAGVGHTAPDNSRQPALVAAVLRTFFGTSTGS